MRKTAQTWLIACLALVLALSVVGTGYAATPSLPSNRVKVAVNVAPTQLKYGSTARYTFEVYTDVQVSALAYSIHDRNGNPLKCSRVYKSTPSAAGSVKMTSGQYKNWWRTRVDDTRLVSDFFNNNFGIVVQRPNKPTTTITNRTDFYFTFWVVNQYGEYYRIQDATKLTVFYPSYAYIIPY